MTNRCRPYLSVLFALAFILFGADESVVQAEARIGLRHPLGGSAHHLLCGSSTS